MLLFCLLQFLFYNFILFAYESKFYFDWKLLKKAKAILFKLLLKNKIFSSELKSNVLRESLRIETSNLQDLIQREPLVVKNLKKEFRRNRIRFMAVNNVSFGIQKKECFGQVFFFKLLAIEFYYNYFNIF